jgi:multidrug transporter EmrE-like cation transporter
MQSDAWAVRVRVFLQRFWQPAGACMTCMPGSLANVWSLAHWTLALQTGFATAVLALLLTFTPARRLYLNPWGNALVVGALTALADAWSHPNHYGVAYAESLLTGLVYGALALVGWYLFKDRARRLRALWSRVTRKSG